MEKNFLITVLLFLFSSNAIAARFVCIADNQFTGRGNINERMLTITKPANKKLSSLTIDMRGCSSISDVVRIKIYSSLTNKFDVHAISNYEELCDVLPKKSGLTVCKFKKKTSLEQMYLFVTYEISETAKEGNIVTAKLKNSNVIASREILLRRTLLYSPGDYNSKNYRIPAVVTAHDGSIVVATDKRKNNQIDLPEDIDVLVNRSTDGGKTWSAPQAIAEGKGFGAGFGDASLVKTANENELLAIYIGGPGFFTSTPSVCQHVYVNKSHDNGQTWTEKTDITNQLYGEGCLEVERRDWNAMFISSGAGVCMRDGTIAFVAVVRETISAELDAISNYVIYSEDAGETWKLSTSCMANHGNEGKITELNDGTWLVSIRNQRRGERYYNISTDRGKTWKGLKQWGELVEPGCNGDLYYYTSIVDGFDKNRILHSIPNNRNHRKNVSLFLSYDEGISWPIGKTICSTGAAYSSICSLPDGTIGVYIEENYEGEDFSMYFLNFSLDWLTDGQDIYSSPKSK